MLACTSLFLLVLLLLPLLLVMLMRMQEDLFKHVGAPMVDNCVVKGYNGTMFTYGQTGSGKTYTMSGGFDFKGGHASTLAQRVLALEADETRGMAPRVLQKVLSRMKEVRTAASSFFTEPAALPGKSARHCTLAPCQLPVWKVDCIGIVAGHLTKGQRYPNLNDSQTDCRQSPGPICLVLLSRKLPASPSCFRPWFSLQEEERRQDEDLKYTCHCSFLEIYKEQVFDLLEDGSSDVGLPAGSDGRSDCSSVSSRPGSSRQLSETPVRPREERRAGIQVRGK